MAWRMRGSATMAAVLTSVLSGSTASAQQPVGVGLRVYRDVDFKGASATFIRDTPDVAGSDLAGVISSVRVAEGEVWEICTESRYRGRCRRVTDEIADLRRGGWNDAVLSVRRIRGGAAPGAGSGARNISGLHLYSDINYRGTSASLTRNDGDLANIGMDGLVSSVRIDPDEVWEVCTEPSYRGRCLRISADVSDLRRGNWNDAILSARRLRGPATSFSGGRIILGLEVFADINYRGRSATFSANTPSVAARGMGATISSLRVPAGEVWEVCTEPDYRGRCTAMTEDTSDLRKGEWNDVIASVRRVR